MKTPRLLRILEPALLVFLPSFVFGAAVRVAMSPDFIVVADLVLFVVILITLFAYSMTTPHDGPLAQLPLWPQLIAGGLGLMLLLGYTVATSLVIKPDLALPVRRSILGLDLVGPVAFYSMTGLWSARWFGALVQSESLRQVRLVANLASPVLIAVSFLR